MPDFSRRSTQAEILDDFSLDNEQLRQNIREIEYINAVLGGNAITLDGLRKLLTQADRSKPIRIADLGCGGADLLRRMVRLAERMGFEVEGIGVDASPAIARFAAEQSADWANIRIMQANIFDPAFALERFDIVTCTLFAHHFEDQALHRLLSLMRSQARLGVVINDLHRHWLAYHSIDLLTRLFSKSYLTRHDAKLSVWRAFSRGELAAALQAAGYQHTVLRWKWAFRWQVIARTDV